MLPTLQAFMTAHGLSNITVVADAGMVSEANKKAIEQAGLSFILGAKTPKVPILVSHEKSSVRPMRAQAPGGPFYRIRTHP